MTHKLTDKQALILIMVDEATQWPGDTRPGQGAPTHFTPHYGGNWCAFLGRREPIGGSGDAAIFRALERKGVCLEDAVARNDARVGLF